MQGHVKQRLKVNDHVKQRLRVNETKQLKEKDFVFHALSLKILNFAKYNYTHCWSSKRIVF